MSKDGGCRNHFYTNICAASQLPGEGPTDWKMLLQLHVNQNWMMIMMTISSAMSFQLKQA